MWVLLNLSKLLRMTGMELASVSSSLCAPHGQLSFSSGPQIDAQEKKKDPTSHGPTLVEASLILPALQKHSWCLWLGLGGRSQRWWTLISKGRFTSVKPKFKQSLPEPNWELTAFECHHGLRVSSVIVLAEWPECTLQTDSWPPALFFSYLVPGFSKSPWVWREAALFSSPIW